MQVWNLCFVLVFVPPLASTLEQDTVAVNMGVHQLQRLVELLTSQECEDLLTALSQEEEDIFQHIDRLSLENNPLSTRSKRQTAESEAQCKEALTDWLQINSENMFHDRLSRALQRIGRTDIAIEVGKNINQDKSLSLKRYVEDYHKFVSSLNVPSGDEDPKTTGRKIRKVTDLTARDLELIVERAPVPAYPWGPRDMALPVLLGFMLGFGGTLLLGSTLLLVVFHVSGRKKGSCDCSETM